jgi:hypothetical protein
MKNFLSKLKASTTESASGAIKTWFYMEARESLDLATLWKKKKNRKTLMVSHPFSILFRVLIPQLLQTVIWKLSDAKWWVYYRVLPKQKYNIVRTELKPGYYDVDVRMLYSSFALLCSYVERECSACYELSDNALTNTNIPNIEKGMLYLLERVNDAIKNGENPFYDKEALELYVWWKILRPIRDNLMIPVRENLPDDFSIIDIMTGQEEITPEHPHYSTYTNYYTTLHKQGHLQHIFDDEDDIMLERLIKIRGSLWT